LKRRGARRGGGRGQGPRDGWQLDALVDVSPQSVSQSHPAQEHRLFSHSASPLPHHHHQAPIPFCVSIAIAAPQPCVVYLRRLAGLIAPASPSPPPPPCQAGYFCAPGSTNATTTQCGIGTYSPSGLARPALWAPTAALPALACQRAVGRVPLVASAT
jgi:hypothetical protein